MDNVKILEVKQFHWFGQQIHDFDANKVQFRHARHNLGQVCHGRRLRS